MNYKTPGLLIDCLTTIYAQTETLPFEVIIVDNDSRDNSEMLVKNKFPRLRWLSMSYNSGFARANNAGIRHSNGDIVLLLNSDTLNTGNAIDGCHRSFRHSEYVACGLQLLHQDLSPQISGNYFMVGGLNNLLPLPYLGNLIKWFGTTLKVNKPHVPDAGEEICVDWINGAFLMVKKSAIDRAGLMDEDFFLYAEEAEWCARLGKIGQLCLFGQFKIIHLQGATSNATFHSSGRGYYNLYDQKGLQIMLSNFVRIRKQFGAGWFLFHLLVYTATIPIYFIGNMLRVILGKKNEANASVKRFGTNVFRLWGMSITILGNRPHFYKVL